MANHGLIYVWKHRRKCMSPELQGAYQVHQQGPVLFSPSPKLQSKGPRGISVQRPDESNDTLHGQQLTPTRRDISCNTLPRMSNRQLPHHPRSETWAGRRGHRPASHLKCKHPEPNCSVTIHGSATSNVSGNVHVV